MVVDIAELKLDGKLVDSNDILGITFNDSAGVKSDKVTVKVMPDFPKPPPKTKLELTFKSFKNGKLIEEMNCGLFHVQAVKRTNNEALSFEATGVEFSEKQKEKISHHYKDTKLSSIVKIVGDRLGHKVKFDNEDVSIKSLNQTNETDINFLSRISKGYNALFSIKNDVIYFVNKDSSSLPVTKLNVDDCKPSYLKHSSKTYYNSCEASYHDVDAGKIITVKVGDGTPTIKIENAFKDVLDARAKAKAKLKSINSGIVNGSLSLKAKALYAGTKVDLFNTYKSEDDGIYNVESCSHSYSRGGGWTATAEILN